jgi:AcrR family transcriptional regulator
LSAVLIHPVRSTRKPRGEGHARRAEILVAAEQIFAEHGYEGATIRKIADAVGLSSTALYMHFPDKGAILHEICRNAFERLCEGQQQILGSATPPSERLRRLLQAYIDFGFDNPNAYRLIYLTRPDEAQQAQAAAQEVGTDLFRAFEVVVEEAEAKGLLRAGAHETARTLWAGVHGVVSLMITKPYFDWPSREVLSGTMLDALFTGLLKP